MPLPVSVTAESIARCRVLVAGAAKAAATPAMKKTAVKKPAAKKTASAPKRTA